MTDDTSPSLPDLHATVKVGSVILPGNLFLAPVAGYSDAAYRSVCIAEGADLCYTEMVSSEALVRSHRKTGNLLDRAPNETVYAIQLFGSNPEVLARAVAIALEWKPLLIDLNCGCPVPKVVKTGSGSALSRDPAKLEAVCRAMSGALAGTGVPLTVKIRLGWDSGSVNWGDSSAAAVEGGAAAVTLHARTRAQGYAGSADWTAIAALVRHVGVPVFGSGDLFSGAAARRMLVETGAAGVMIARGAMGNPFIFQEARAALEGREAPALGRGHRINAARRHLGLSIGFLGERPACLEFRKHFCAYTKGEVQGAALRAEAVRATSAADFDSLFARWASGATAAD
jgi:nifR3 family TIM-barrel protein